MEIIPIVDANSNFNKVYIFKGTPHCKDHGAMNKMIVFEGGAYWRCICSVSKKNENNCRAACQQVTNK